MKSNFPISKNDMTLKKFKKNFFLGAVIFALSSVLAQAMEESTDEFPTNPGRGTLSILPDEILIKTLSFLPAKELAIVATVSKEMKSFSEDNIVWRGIANEADMPSNGTTTDPIKKQLKDYLSSQFIDGKDQQLTIGKLKSYVENPSNFKVGKRSFSIRNANSGAHNLDHVSPDTSVTFKWEQDLSYWGCSLQVGEMDSQYYSGNYFIIEELKKENFL